MRIAIIGAGAAGCFAAANIPFEKGREVIVFEKTGKALQKVKASGGGRCNVTHHLFDIAELADRYPRGRQLLRKTLHHFNPANTIEWFETRGIHLKAETDGRMFPVTDNSQTIIDTIWQEMVRNKTELRYHKTVRRIEKKEGKWRIDFVDESSYEADKILIACGGFPKEESYAWLQAMGHSIEEPVPSLFTFNIPKHPITALMGVSVADAGIKIAGTKIAERGPVLITHWGLSGPAILRCSAWGARALHETGYDFKAMINWLGTATEEEVKSVFIFQRQENGKQFISSKNPFEIPRRLWEFLLSASGITEQTRWGELSAAGQNKLLQHLIRQEFQVKGKTTYKEEFVTCGGIKLSEIHPQTMESRIAPGIYFAGEIMNVDAITGGFNFQHAWTSAFIAARHLLQE